LSGVNARELKMDCHKVVEILFSFALTVNAALFIPQGLKLFKTQNPQDLSLLTFLGFNILQLLGILHCYLQKDYSPMLGWLASFITCGAITLMIVYFRNKKMFMK